MQNVSPEACTRPWLVSVKLKTRRLPDTSDAGPFVRNSMRIGGRSACNSRLSHCTLILAALASRYDTQQRLPESSDTYALLSSRAFIIH